ncbi:MAG: response regulator transcription factor [Clostridia bacterium]|nr:response regulator transcription factor [Clostridia bacterium]
MQRLILVVEDEKPILDILQFNLEKEGYKVITAMDGEEAIAMALQVNPDLILLDVMLPKLDGFEVCKNIRTWSAAPIIMLTAKGEEVDKILGLEIGADDYITKPFSMRELSARIKANMRRSTSTDSEPQAAASGNGKIISAGSLKIDCDRYEVYRDDEPIILTLREFELIKFLATQPEKVFSREKLLEQVWGYEFFGDVRTVDVTVRRLREKVESDPSAPRYIMTKRGVGYYFNNKEV